MKQYQHTITVQGSGAFPIDMLRYDSCYPLTESDSYQIALTGTHPEYFRPPRTITVTREAHRHWLPTAARWSSFTWTVTEHDYNG